MANHRTTYNYMVSIYLLLIKSLEIMSLYYLSTPQKEEFLKPLLIKKELLCNELFLAKVFKKERQSIDEKLICINAQIDSLKKYIEIPLYKF